VALLPAFGMLAVVAPPSGRLVGRIGPRRPMVAGLLIAAAGLALLADDALLAASVLWGLGLGLLTPSVVAAAMGAVERDRAGLAAAVNNTSRQAGGALGIAASGAVAGSPAGAGFVQGFHTVALGAAGLYVAAAALAWAAVPGRQRASAARTATPSAPGRRCAPRSTGRSEDDRGADRADREGVGEPLRDAVNRLPSGAVRRHEQRR